MGLVGIIYFCGRKHPVLYGHRAAASVSSPFYKPAWFHHDSIWLSRSHHFIWRAVGKSDCSKGQTWTFNLPFKSIHNDTEDLTFQRRCLQQDWSQPCVRKPRADWLLSWDAKIEKKPNSAGCHCWVCKMWATAPHGAHRSKASTRTKFKCISHWGEVCKIHLNHTPPVLSFPRT